MCVHPQNGTYFLLDLWLCQYFSCSQFKLLVKRYLLDRLIHSREKTSQFSVGSSLYVTHVCWILDQDCLAHHLWYHESCVYTQLLKSNFQWAHRKLAFSVINVKKIHVRHCTQWNSNNWMNNKENSCDWRRKNWSNRICKLMFQICAHATVSQRDKLIWLRFFKAFCHPCFSIHNSIQEICCHYYPPQWLTLLANFLHFITACWAHTLSFEFEMISLKVGMVLEILSKREREI